jgi:hypothetical protein
MRSVTNRDIRRPLSELYGRTIPLYIGMICVSPRLRQRLLDKYAKYRQGILRLRSCSYQWPKLMVFRLSSSFVSSRSVRTLMLRSFDCSINISPGDVWRSAFCCTFRDASGHMDTEATRLRYASSCYLSEHRTNSRSNRTEL